MHDGSFMLDLAGSSAGLDLHFLNFIAPGSKKSFGLSFREFL